MTHSTTITLRLIDLSVWHRKEIFDYYMTHPETFTITASIDITHLLETIKSTHLKFNPVMIYLISETLNQHDEFKMTLDEEQRLGQWDVLHPLYSEMHPQTKNIMHLFTPYQPHFQLFYRQCLEDKIKWVQSQRLFPQPSRPKNLFQVACVPWTSFTSFYIDKPFQNDLTPVITYGKYNDNNGHFEMPIAITLHHAVADGYHASRFISELEEKAKNFNG